MNESRLVLLTNVYNEEYLLPFWLEHHKPFFDHGIVVDYNSTDRSMDIVREICPTWEIRQTANPDFDAVNLDKELMQIEDTLNEKDYKYILNTTEFFFPHPDFRSMLDYTEPSCYPVRTYALLSDEIDIYPETLKDIISTIQRFNLTDRSCRYFHSFRNGNYGTGRHCTFNSPISDVSLGMNLWLGYHPWNESLKKRKLQIGDRLSQNDRACGYGVQHTWDLNQMEGYRNTLKDNSLSVDEVDYYKEIIGYYYKDL